MFSGPFDDGGGGVSAVAEHGASGNSVFDRWRSDIDVPSCMTDNFELDMLQDYGAPASDFDDLSLFRSEPQRADDPPLFKGSQFRVSGMPHLSDDLFDCAAPFETDSGLPSSSNASPPESSDENPPDSKPIKSEKSFEKSSNRMPLFGGHFSLMESTKIEKQDENEDFIDVEGFSDGESLPTIEKLTCESATKKERPIAKVCVAKVESKPDEPVFVEYKLKKAEIISSSLSGENVFLDHDYCSSPVKKGPKVTPIKLVRRPVVESKPNGPHAKVDDLCGKNSANNAKQSPQDSAVAGKIVNNTRSHKTRRNRKSSKVNENTIQNIMVFENRTEKIFKTNSPLKPMVSLLKNNYVKTAEQPEGFKRKLSLQDYKKRNDKNSHVTLHVAQSLEAKKANSPSDIIVQARPQNGLVESQNKVIYDPIAAAAKKALKLKQLPIKKIENDIDKIVMSKIPKVNNLLILPIATKNGKLLPMIKTIDEEDVPIQRPVVEKRRNSLYEEIVMVSIGVNTNSSNIVNENNNILERKNSENDHGEDKIIIHRMKNFAKPETRSIHTQTDVQTCVVPKEKPAKIHSALNYCQISNVAGVNYNDLLDRWKSDPATKEESSSSKSSEELSCKSEGRPSRDRNKNAKYKYRRRGGSASSDSSYSPSPYSKNRTLKNNGNHCKSENSLPSSKECFSDDRSVKSLPAKRKRNISASSDETNAKHNRRNKSRGENSRSSSVSSDSSESSCTSSSSSSSGDSRSSNSSTGSYRSRHAPKRANSPKRNRRRNGDKNFEERKIVYVGMLESNITVSELKLKFVKYGPIEDVKIHTKDDGMRYGFVTFLEAHQTYTVLEKAPSDPDISHYDVFFGGRRTFCKQTYEDLDELEAMQEESEYYPTIISRTLATIKPTNSFDALLEEAKAILDARKIKSKKFVYASLTN